MKKTFPPGTICERCAMTREDVKRMQFECNVYGKHYGHHHYNREPLTLKTEFIEIP